ncbi:CYTH domain-containing protein [Vallitalea sp.]|jgi:CYTH domain-containing protein|uniref:CYTH domain-containing protein n=1 Tax=Vallitalea sp. TaxID=1882829 RepID=UPI0025D5F2D1|nr:CYTH domain-containing protein [Vallitalea sp.]MCT4685867.1 CYTH domain-containing protein [Vallitalea sp.]
MEIEKKYLINLPLNKIARYPHINIEQGYISTNPVIRIRKTDKSYYVTYKSSGLMVRQEFEDEISKEQYNTLKSKVDYNLISKKRYYIPLDNSLTVELDIFNDKLEGLIMAEVEFDSEESANNFTPPSWFVKEVTFDTRFHNSNLCKEENISFLDEPL